MSSRKNDRAHHDITIKGATVSPGIEMAKVWKIIENCDEAEHKPRSIDETEIKSELERFHKAVKTSREQLESLRDIISERLGGKEAGIFSAHICILEDPHILEAVSEKLRHDKKNIEYVVSEVIKKFSKMFSMLEDNLMRERSSDIRDVGQRLLKNLLSEKKSLNLEPNEKVIIVAKELIPSITVKVSDNILGFAVEHGEMTSHAAILARSLNIPAIAGLEKICSEVETGDMIILDGINSTVTINPSAKIVSEYKRLQIEYSLMKDDQKEAAKLPSITKDGVEIKLSANINKISDIELVKTFNASSIGLFRTEFIFMSKDKMPDEDEQYHIYKNIIQNADGREVTIRVLDIGADKTLPYFVMPQEFNPQLGWRGIRVLLNEIDLFKNQIKAILRASVHGPVKILLPMVSTLSEVIEARDIIEEARFELGSRALSASNVKIGVMIEVPATAFILDQISKHVDFFSIGTNDLIQYILAVDRTNPRVAHFYEPLHPAVLNFIKIIVDSANKYRKEITLCGELAGDTLFTMILLGLGLKNLSMSPTAIAGVRKIIRSVKLSKCVEITNELLKFTCINDSKKFIKENIFPVLDYSICS